MNRRSIFPLIAIIFGILLILISIGTILYRSNNQIFAWRINLFKSSEPKQSITRHDLLYSVYGSARTATITWVNDTGGIEQKQVDLPFQRVYRGFSPRMPVSIVAQITDQSAGSINCEIIYNNERISKSSSEGAYTITNCSASIPDLP